MTQLDKQTTRVVEALQAVSKAVQNTVEVCDHQDVKDLALAAFKATGASRLLADVAMTNHIPTAAALLGIREKIQKTFGAPGDWGYEHPIGRAIHNLYTIPILGGSPQTREAKLRTALKELVDIVSYDELLPESVSYMKQARKALAG